MSTEKIGIYPGSFDPVTLGHLDIIKRSAKLFDKLIVGILVNQSKSSLFSLDERVMMMKSVTKDISGVEVMTFDGLLVDFAASVGSNTIVRGLRAISDFEYELQMAQVNRTMSPDLDTIFLATDLKYSYLSSSIVKEVASFGGKIEEFLPEEIIPLVKNKYKK